MCAPQVMDTVNRELSRRHALGLLVAPAVASTPLHSLATPQQNVMCREGFSTIRDLTHVLTPNTPVFPGVRPIQVTPRITIARNGIFGNEVTFTEHCGTHLDAPAHFAAEGRTTDQMDAREFFAPLAVISIADRASRDPDTGVTVDDLRAWEREHGRLPEGTFVAMDSGWDRRVTDSKAFVNADAQEVMHFPGFTVEAAEFLTKERVIVGVGVDTLSLDVGMSSVRGAYPAHLTLLPAGKYGLELMANLNDVPPSGATLIVGAPKHQGGSGGPARVFAVS